MKIIMCAYAGCDKALPDGSHWKKKYCDGDCRRLALNERLRERYREDGVFRNKMKLRSNVWYHRNKDEE